MNENHAPSPTLTAAELLDHSPERRLVGRNATKADVLSYRVEGREVAVKTYAPRPFWIRQLLGRFLIRRETTAYLAAGGVSGLPDFLGRLDAFTLATAWVQAAPLAARRGERIDDRVFDAVAGILAELHERGVAVADLHHRDVLLTEDDEVYLVDLAMAFVLGRRPGPLRRAIFRRLREQDQVALARMRARFTGCDVEAAVAAVGGNAAAWHRRGRRIKTFLDRLRGKKRRAEPNR